MTTAGRAGLLDDGAAPPRDTGPADASVARSAVAKMSWRILPLLGLGYLLAYMDRVNISFAALQMNADLGFSATIYGLGGGLFFLSYAMFEIPSNMLLSRVGARRWLARIMVTWGVLAAGMMFVQTPMQFYVMRFLLGMAEAGFFPGVIYYLAHWFPGAYRGRAISRFYVTGALAAVVMGAASGWLLGLDGKVGLEGWQWLFLVQGAPSVLVGLLILRFLPDAPSTSSWLTIAERRWLERELRSEADRIGKPGDHAVLAALRSPVVARLGLFGALTVGAFMTFTLSAPLLLREVTSLGAGPIGWIVSAGGLFGAAGMLLTGWYSDRRGERFTTMLSGTALVGLAYLTIAISATPTVIIAAYLIFMAAYSAVTLSNVMLWPDLLHVRQLAVGSAAINTMSQVGAFLMPFGWGVARDATGGYGAGLGVLGAAMLCALVIAARVKIRVAASHADRAAHVPSGAA